MVKQHLSSTKEVQKVEAGRREIAVKPRAKMYQAMIAHPVTPLRTKPSCGVNPWENGGNTFLVTVLQKAWAS